MPLLTLRRRLASTPRELLKSRIISSYLLWCILFVELTETEVLFLESRLVIQRKNTNLVISSKPKGMSGRRE